MSRISTEAEWALTRVSSGALMAICPECAAACISEYCALCNLMSQRQARVTGLPDVRYSCAYIGGTFDVLHSGHIALFRRAKEIAETVVVSVNTDAFAEAYKRRPLVPLTERMAVIEACRWVDRVIVNTGGADSKDAILVARPDCIVHGDDWTGDSLMRQMGLTPEFLTAHRIAMVYMPYTVGVSTTKLRGL